MAAYIVLSILLFSYCSSGVHRPFIVRSSDDKKALCLDLQTRPRASKNPRSHTRKRGLQGAFKSLYTASFSASIMSSKSGPMYSISAGVG